MTREEAIEILQGAIKKPNTKDGYLGQAIDMAIKALEQEPKTGHWIKHGIDESYAILVYTCSECDYLIGVVVSNFCPNCGADMRGEE